MLMRNRMDYSLKVCIDPDTFALMEQARAYLNLDKSKFVRQSVRRMAEAVIAEHEHKMCRDSVSSPVFLIQLK
ncbi:MAG: DUF1778 domain-containing protein [bacterium]|nr:DUF1778 domain-containing protein [bacterium]